MTESKALIERYLQALSGREKTPDLVEQYVADPKLAEHIADTEKAFPRYELLSQEMIGEGDRVVVRGEFRGTHAGPFAGIEPTGKSVTAGLIIIYQIQGQRIVNHWMQFDLFALFEQLRGKPVGAHG
ncbi:MAG: ester cyclase [Bryobacteraceae bacterium]